MQNQKQKIVEELEKRIPSINIDSKQAFKCSNAKLFIFIAQTMWESEFRNTKKKYKKNVEENANKWQVIFEIWMWRIQMTRARR